MRYFPYILFIVLLGGCDRPMSTKIKQMSFTVDADFHQFYLMDGTQFADISRLWNKENARQLLAVATGVVGIGTARLGQVPVEVMILESAPSPAFESWEHVTEASLVVPSGIVKIGGPTEPWPNVQSFRIRAGTYRMRIYYGDLKSVRNETEGNDHYKIQIWPGEHQNPAVLKEGSFMK
jgi:hypothetical protein